MRVSKVDKRFRDLSRDGSLWQHELTLDYDDIEQKTNYCMGLVERCKKLVTLKILNKSENCILPIITTMNVVIKAKDTLKCLDIDSSMRDWTPTAMSQLGQMKNLTCLTMSFNSEALTVNWYAGAKILKDLAKLQKLEVLNLEISNRWILGEDSLTIMKSVFQDLKKLKNVKITLPASDYDESLVTTLATNNPDLKGLRFMNYPSLSDESVDVLAKSCPGLQELNFRFRNGDRDINKLASSFPNLKQLFAMASDRFDDEQSIELVQKFRKLEKLEFYIGSNENVTDSGIERMVGAAKNLKYLRVFWANKVTRNLVERLRVEYPDLDLEINDY